MSDLKTLSAEQIAEAKALRDGGMAWTKISRQFGCSPDTIKRALDPAYRQHRAEGIAAARRAREAGVPLPQGRPINLISEGTAVARDARRLMDMIPPDTRSLTGRIFGDPLPGRSALDHRGQA